MARKSKAKKTSTKKFSKKVTKAKKKSSPKRGSKVRPRGKKTGLPGSSGRCRFDNYFAEFAEDSLQGWLQRQRR